MLKRGIVFSLPLIMSAVFADHAQAQQTPPNVWQTAADSLKKQPGLLCASIHSRMRPPASPTSQTRQRL